jgi:hypothetical protein
VLLNQVAIGDNSVNFDAYSSALQFTVPGFYRVHVRTVASLSDVNMQPNNPYNYPSSVTSGITIDAYNGLTVSGPLELRTTSSITLNHARPVFDTWEREYFIDATQVGAEMRIYTTYCMAGDDSNIDPGEWMMKHDTVISVERLTNKTPDTVHVFNLFYSDGAYIDPNNKIDSWVLSSSFGKAPANIVYNDGTGGNGFPRFIFNQEGVYKVSVQTSVKRSSYSDPVSEPAPENLSCEYGTNIVSRELATVLVQSNLKSNASVTLNTSTGSLCTWTQESYVLVRTPGASVSVVSWFNSHFAGVVMIEEWRLDYEITVAFERIMSSSSIPLPA